MGSEDDIRARWRALQDPEAVAAWRRELAARVVSTRDAPGDRLAFALTPYAVEEHGRVPGRFDGHQRAAVGVDGEGRAVIIDYAWGEVELRDWEHPDHVEQVVLHGRPALHWHRGDEVLTVEGGERADGELAVEVARLHRDDAGRPWLRLVTYESGGHASWEPERIGQHWGCRASRYVHDDAGLARIETGGPPRPLAVRQDADAAQAEALDLHPEGYEEWHTGWERRRLGPVDPLPEPSRSSSSTGPA